MDDREAELRELVAALREYDVIDDAWIAKSFTDQLIVIDVERGAALPANVRTLLAEHDLKGFNEVHGVDDGDRSLVGSVTEVNRHQFVDVRTRGDHRSYVAD